MRFYKSQPTSHEVQTVRSLSPRGFLGATKSHHKAPAESFSAQFELPAMWSGF